MKLSFKKGFSYGLTSAVITTLGLMVGLDASTNSKLAVLGGIIIIAFADALSDALGIHVSEESENKHTQMEIWESTFATFFTKAGITLTFIVPLLLLELSTAIIANIIWGMILIASLSFYIGEQQRIKTYFVVLEHLGIAIAVIIVAYYIGKFVAAVFG